MNCGATVDKTGTIPLVVYRTVRNGRVLSGYTYERGVMKGNRLVSTGVAYIPR